MRFKTPPLPPLAFFIVFTRSGASVAKLGAQGEVVERRVGRLVRLDHAGDGRKLVEAKNGPVLAIGQPGADARPAAVGAKRVAGDVGSPSSGNQRRKRT